MTAFWLTFPSLRISMMSVSVCCLFLSIVLGFVFRRIAVLWFLAEMLIMLG